MMDTEEQAIDTLLRGAFDGPVADDGFSRRVARVLPPRRKTRDWPVLLAMATGVLACGYVLQSGPLGEISAGSWTRLVPDSVALACAVSLVFAWLAAAWCITELGEGYARADPAQTKGMR